MDGMTVNEAAKALQVTPGRVRQLITEGRINASRFGSQLLITRADLEAFRQSPPLPRGRPKKQNDTQ